MARDIKQLLEETENCRKEERWDDSFKLQKYIFEKYPSNIESLSAGVEAGMFMLQKKKSTEALKFFQKVKRRYGGDWYALARMQIGITYIRMRKYEKAKKEFITFRKSIEKDNQTIDNFLKFCEKMIEKK